MVAGGVQVIPFYVVCDVSSSMRGARIASVNEGLPEIHRVISSDPVISEKIRFGIISFASAAQVVLPLCRLTELAKMPELKAKGRTNFADAIRLARETILNDINQLKLHGFSVLRPVVYFITDGRPTGGWIRERDAWVDREANSYAPNIICFGVDEADRETLGRMSTRFTFIAKAGVDPGVALREVVRSIAASVVASGRHQEGGLQMPLSSTALDVFDAERQ